VDRFRSGSQDVRPDRIQPVAFFVPTRQIGQHFYIVAHESRQQAKESWAKLVSDPEFKEMSQKGASIGSVKVDSMFVDPLDFSPIK
jgi:hypothetical protein